MDFFTDLLKRLVTEGRLDPAAPTLVVAGDGTDRDALLAAGFTDATISNLDTRMTGDELAPYAWTRLDAEALALEDDSFDQVIEHMGLHHCRSPHAALLEMYRVARKAVLVVENRDSATMRLAVRLGLGADFELQAVRDGGHEFGGHRNSAIPNYVYRWTEREVSKALASADPAHQADVSFHYGFRFPRERARAERGIKRFALEAARLPFALYARALPRQANVFAFLIDKSARKLHPWMEPSGARMKSDFSS